MSTPIEDKTDWIDRGVFAPCSFNGTRGAQLDCDTPALFDLSKCDPRAFAGVDRHGGYQTELRSDDVYPFYLGFILPPDGGVDLMAGQTATRKQFDDQGFYLSLTTSVADGGSRQYSLAGCGVPEANHITGCYTRCINGKLVDKGTFNAERMKWGRGEAESGGLDLASESFVSLGFPADVYVTKNHAYVVSVRIPKTGPAGGLTVFDVSDKHHPVMKKQISLPGDSYWNAAWAKDDALYIASQASGVIVYDISNPADPVFVRSLPGGAPLDIHTLFVDGNRLYAMALWPVSQTLIFDVSTPLVPVLLNRITIATGEDLFSYPHDAFAYEGRLYISHTNSGYVVADVSDPYQVRELGRYAYALAYSHASAVGTFAGRTIAFEGGEGEGTHLRVLDVTDPAHIQLIGEHRLRQSSSIHNMVLKGTRLYVAWYHEGVRVLDVANPTKPKEIAWFNNYREFDPGRQGHTYEGAIGMRVPGDGFIYAVDTARGLLIFKEP
ncbi:LVIVD repeat-containing protein [Corallococcus sp. CA053C]|uniref:LVIVD repeat-containing protein n=1 Tax=Corallococcus sp. CA053C TaxID=2316732 RepID=UPI001F26B0A0|nr:hypothetical protein [Corallococcus sp. CA053C]